MKTLLFILGLFFSVVVTAQFAPTSSKTKFSNGIALGTRDSTAYGVNDSLVVVIDRNGKLIYRSTDGYWKSVATGGNLGLYMLLADSANLVSPYRTYFPRMALSFAAGSGAYNSSTGVITIPTNTSQLTNSSFVDLTTAQTVAGAKTFSSDLNVNGLGVGRGGGNIAGNTAIGLLALNANTTGTSNTAFGLNALISNTTGNFNTANGVSALQNNTTGYSNTANGVSALNANTTGYSNTAIGVYALLSNTTGSNNTANGLSSLQNNTTGTSNTANGVSALGNNTTGFENTAIGVYALLSNTTGYSNTANGFEVLRSNTTGFQNTAIGRNAGYGTGTFPNTTGSNNTYVGFQTRGDASTNTNETVIGSTAIGNGSNTMTFGNTSVTNNYFTGNIRGGAFIRTGGTSSQYLMADGTTTAIGSSGVTSVAALTLGTTGTDLSSTVATGTTTPVITLNVPNASASNRGALLAADWTTFNNKQNTITNPVTGTGVDGRVAIWNGTNTQTSDVNLTMSASQFQTFGFVVNGAGAALPGVTGGNFGAAAYGNGFLMYNGSNNFRMMDRADVLNNLDATTVGVNFLKLPNPSAITFPRINADNSVSALNAADFRTAIGLGTSSSPTFAGGFFTDGSQGLNIRPYTFVGAGTGAIYVTTLTPSNQNFVFAASSTSTSINSPTGGTVNLSINGQTPAITINTNSTISLTTALSSTAGISATTGAFSSTVASTSTTTGAVTIAGGLGVAGNINAANLVSGTYTPTLTDAGNTSARSASVCQYMRVGNVVTVSGRVTITATTNGVNTAFYVTLPIASTFANGDNVGGTLVSEGGVAGYCEAEAGGSDRAIFSFKAGTTSSQLYRWSFTYIIL